MLPESCPAVVDGGAGMRACVMGWSQPADDSRCIHTLLNQWRVVCGIILKV